MENLHEMLHHHLISLFGDSNWLHRSPDWPAPNNILWGYLKSHVFETWPATWDECRANIREATQAIPHDILQYVTDDFTKHLRESILHSVFRK
jgi:hypothetical protein